MKNRLRTNIARIAFALVLGSGLVLQATAQDTNTIRIEDGKVYINDKRVPAEDLPESLDIADMSAKFSFWGNDRAFLDLGGQIYLLQDGRLIEASSDETDDGLVVYFAAEGEGTPVRFLKRDDGAAGYFNVRSTGDNTYAYYGDALFDQARKMEELRDRLAAQKATQIRVGEIEGTVVELTDAAHNTARMAEALPRIQFQSYLESIGDRDAALFEQLQREQHLEMRTRSLAQRIRTSADPSERKKLVEELRRDLETIFELKQTNREREIEQLAHRLEALQARLDERQNLQQEIIEARLNELIGRSDW